jgi:oligopeptide/dipeptide ABC transporter ATP-binding protein
LSALLTLRDLRVGLSQRGQTVELVRGVDLEVQPGEKLGVVGESGSGKTLTMLSVLQLLPPPLRIVGGQVDFSGEDLRRVPAGRLREVRGGEIAMVYQDPMSSLNPLLRVRTQLVETLRAHGADSGQARARSREALVHVGLPDPDRIAHAFPHELSGGMLQRVMIAMALATSPRLLVADEPTTALDVTIQQQILLLVERLQAETGMAVVWVTHDLGVVARLVERVAVMYAGRVVEVGKTREVFADPRHPYTAALIASLPGPATGHRAQLRQIGGAPPDPARLQGGCPFRFRCASADERCAAEEPPLLQGGPGRLAACWKEPSAWVR